MSLEAFTKKTAAVVKDNSPSILAALGVGSIVTTGLLAHKAGYNYGRDVQFREDEGEAPLTGKEKFEGYWRDHIPVFLSGVIGITCVISSTAIGNRRNAALAGLVTAGEATLREYKEKVREVVTKPKAEQIEKELAQEKLDKNQSNEVIYVGDGDILLFDTLTSRTFKSSKLAVEKAEVEIGRKLLSEMYVSQNEWYDEIGLPRISMGDEQGWNHDHPLHITFIPLEKEDKPVLGISYQFRPSIGFDRFG